MRNQLIEKLNRLLTDRATFSEAEVIYFLVESRKLLDRKREDGENVFPLVRFYADWSVHTEKDRHLASIDAIVEQLVTSAASTSEASAAYVPERLQPHVDFIYMAALREELRAYLQRFGIADPFSDDAVWNAFVTSLTAVLQDQPILKPHPDIEEIRYELSVPGSAILIVAFRDRKPVRVGKVF
jgi:hypothetical protein